MRISHSGKSTFKQCAFKYKLHYVDKLRTQKLYSSLFFGNALDAAFSRLLLEKKKVLSQEESLQLLESADDIFYKNMCKVESNGEFVEASKSPLADYYTSDFTPELLTSKAISLLEEYAPDVSDYFAFMEACKKQLKSKKKLSADDLPLYNYISWLTMIEKGYLMIEAYQEQIMPQIFEVYSIQEEVSIKNGPYQREVIDPRGMTESYWEETYDEIIGKIDFTASFVDKPGTMYVCDNKSSSKAYKASQTAESDQLATYCEYKQTNKAAYIVIEKKLHMKKPTIRTQVLKADLTEERFSLTFGDYEKVLYSISTGAFDKNPKACYEYGRLCPFFLKCKHNNSEGLVKKKEAEECPSLK